MTKHLSIAVALVFAVACKADAPAPANAAPPAGNAAPAGEGAAGKARSARIDVKPVQPALPEATPEDKPRDDAQPRGNRDEWRKRRGAKLDADGDGVVSDEERAAAMRERVT